MISRKLRRMARGQGGFTLIEVLAALAVTGIIALGATTASFLVLNQGTKNGDYVTASQHSMNAIYWISRDAQMSQTIVPGETSGFPLTLDWVEWDNTDHEVVYHIEGASLYRSYSIDDSELRDTLVAQYIDTIGENTVCTFADRVLTVKMTATVGEGVNTVSVTKEREIAPRPGL